MMHQVSASGLFSNLSVELPRGGIYPAAASELDVVLPAGQTSNAVRDTPPGPTGDREGLLC